VVDLSSVEILTSKFSALQNASTPILQTAIKQIATSGTSTPAAVPIPPAIATAIVETITVSD
jgi:hypothetical protein